MQFRFDRPAADLQADGFDADMVAAGKITPTGMGRGRKYRIAPNQAESIGSGAIPESWMSPASSTMNERPQTVRMVSNVSGGIARMVSGLNR